MQQLSLGSKSFDQQDQLQAIDALRGYAILLVISVHSVGYVRELVWPVLRIFGLGFYGVQLFFIASAVTLLMSWNRGGRSILEAQRKVPGSPLFQDCAFLLCGNALLLVCL